MRQGEKLKREMSTRFANLTAETIKITGYDYRHVTRCVCVCRVCGSKIYLPFRLNYHKQNSAHSSNRRIHTLTQTLLKFTNCASTSGSMSVSDMQHAHCAMQNNNQVEHGTHTHSGETIFDVLQFGKNIARKQCETKITKFRAYRIAGTHVCHISIYILCTRGKAWILFIYLYILILFGAAAADKSSWAVN